MGGHMVQRRSQARVGMGWKRTEGRFCRQGRKSTSVCIDAKSPILYPHPRRLSPAWKPTGSVSIGELTSVSGLFGLKIERDLHFEPPRDCRRPFRLSHAAMAGSSSIA